MRQHGSTALYEWVVAGVARSLLSVMLAAGWCMYALTFALGTMYEPCNCAMSLLLSSLLLSRWTQLHIEMCRVTVLACLHGCMPAEDIIQALRPA